jgi:hypothetical protein
VSLTTLGEALAIANQFPLDAELFLPFDEVWGSSTRCAVEPVYQYADGSTLPQIALQNGLESALNVAQFQDIVENARQQRPGASVAQLVEAFLFYFDRDAFIDFDKHAEPNK